MDSLRQHEDITLANSSSGFTLPTIIMTVLPELSLKQIIIVLHEMEEEQCGGKH